MSVDPEGASTEAVDPDLALDPATTPSVDEDLDDEALRRGDDEGFTSDETDLA